MEFASVFKDEMTKFIEFRTAQRKDLRNTLAYLKLFDKMLVSEAVSEKYVSEYLVTKWLNSRNVTSPTKSNMYSVVKLFSDYVRTLELIVETPDRPKKASLYSPYLFSEDEMTAIFNAADNLKYPKKQSAAITQTPVLIRLLYGCGLRLGETLRIKWDEINLNEGVIRICYAKNLKQRTIPISDSLLAVLKGYRQIAEPFELVFPGRGGRIHSEGGVRKWFGKMLDESGIKYTRAAPHERGPCIHCLRHVFALASFTAVERAGINFSDFVPFLSTYLGHNTIMETDKYLRANYILYTDEHKKLGHYINHLFPEVKPYENETT